MDEAGSFIAGILQKIREMTAFLNPLPNSYERLGAFEAPKYVSWSEGNRSQLVRIPAARGDKVRMELRSPDPAANPYLAFALVIGAGIYGIENRLPLPESVNVDLYNADEHVTASLERLPENLEEALTIAEKSQFVRDILGIEAAERYIRLKRQELTEYCRAADKREHFLEHYFKVI